MATLGTAVLLAQIEEEARLQGVDPAIAKALFLSENSYHDKQGNLKTKGSVSSETVSPKMAQGFMQVIPTTFQGLKDQGFIDPFADPMDPKTQIKAGVATIKELNSRGIKNPMEVAVAYNGGNAALQAFRKNQPRNPETADYEVKFSKHLTGASPLQGVSHVATTSTTTERTQTQNTTRNLPEGLKNELVQRMRQQSKESGDNQALLKQMAVDMGIDAETYGAAVDADVAAKVELTKADAAISNKINESKRNVLTTFGIDANDPNSLVVSAQERIAALNEEQTGLSDQIANLKGGADPITNPIGWLMSSIQQMPLIAKHNAIVQKKQTALTQLTQAQGLASNQANLQVPSVIDETNRQSIAKANALIAEGTKEKVRVSGAARANIAQTLINSMNISGHDITNQIKINELLSGTSTTTSISGESMSESDKAENARLAHVNLMLGTFGQPAFTPDTFKVLPKDTQARLVRNAQFSGTGNGFRLGGSPGESVVMMHDVFGRQGVEEFRKAAPAAAQLVDEMLKHGETRIEALRTMAAKPGVDSAKAEAKLKGIKDEAGFIELGVELWHKEKMEEVGKNDFSKLSTDNPYKLRYHQVAKMPALKDNPYAQYVSQKPVGVVIDDNLILGQAVIDAMGGKKPLPQVAAELHQFYAKGKTIQAEATRMQQLGFKPIPNYPVIGKVYSTMAVDLASQQSIEQFLVAQVASKAVSEQENFFQQQTPLGVSP